MRSSAIPLILVVLASGCRLSGAQTSVPPEPARTVYRQLFPQPTGLNGYEDLVLAGDFARNAAANAAMTEGATLAMKRHALDQPEIRYALKLLHESFGKPMLSPRDGIDVTTTFPEYAQFRQLARLLAIQEYVWLSEGRTQEAIDDMEDGLRLARAATTDKILISSLVGIAIDTIAVKRIALNIDQMSVRDCDRILRFLTDWLTLPSPAIGAIEAERDSAFKILNQMRRNATTTLKTIAPDDNDPETRALADNLNQHPEQIGNAIDAAQRLIADRYGDLIADLRLPPWQRKETPQPKIEGLAGQLAQTLLPALGQVTDKFTIDQANLQMLAVHAAIRRYRWDNDRLPESLTELKIDKLILDPFVGKPFTYTHTGIIYSLSSAGPLDRGTDGAPPTGERIPLQLRK